ncbi:LPS export ABC transporter ATP-binding protein [bacterium]|nr:LPS export ABC transporter ATP-binding protein [bacterium]
MQKETIELHAHDRAEGRIICEGLVKEYSGRRVVNGVDLAVAKAEVVGLLGPNGAGKTTSFYMIVGLVRPDGGTVYFNGTDVTLMPMYQRARLGIGYLPQEASVFRKLTVRENILAVLEILPQYAGKSTMQLKRVEELLEELNLTRVANTRAYSLSGGERRRTEIARALACDPSFMLLDEPFAGIDPIAVEDLQKLIRQVQQKGIGILITDHNVRETLNICDRAYIVSEGKVIESGTPEHISQSAIARKFYLGESFDY